ncbi:MAG TPA: xanthine dehydrogenase family protein subunit M [Rhizomicrobium sp.]|jgi:xanthine dehydrogenase YagS FAD-binding subunit
MRSFEYVRVSDVAMAVHAAQNSDAATFARSQFLAGGTTLLDLMKLDVMQPADVIDINDLSAEYGSVELTPNGLHLGALARMATVADDPSVQREYPVIAQSLQLAASQQIRNMATLGGNVLQRTRCSYFRDVSWSTCNKRIPHSGCAAIDGVNRKHAVLGASDDCIATYAGDFAQALVALDADTEIVGVSGPRRLRFEVLHALPGSTPQIETVLAPGDVITGFFIPAAPWARRSLYLKVRDRASYEFALASAAVAIDVQHDTVRTARIALGGVATKPWRARAAESILQGKPLSAETARAAAETAFADATVRKGNAYKVDLGKRILIRALLQAADV